MSIIPAPKCLQWFELLVLVTFIHFIYFETLVMTPSCNCLISRLVTFKTSHQRTQLLNQKRITSTKKKFLVEGMYVVCCNSPSSDLCYMFVKGSLAAVLLWVCLTVHHICLFTAVVLYPQSRLIISLPYATF